MSNLGPKSARARLEMLDQWVERRVMVARVSKAAAVATADHHTDIPRDHSSSPVYAPDAARPVAPREPTPKTAGLDRRPIGFDGSRGTCDPTVLPDAEKPNLPPPDPDIIIHFDAIARRHLWIWLLVTLVLVLVTYGLPVLTQLLTNLMRA